MRTVKSSSSPELIAGHKLLMSGDARAALIKLLEARDLGNLASYYFIALVYSGTYPEFEDATKYAQNMKIAADSGIELALFDLGSYYYRNEDYVNSSIYYESAAQKGIIKAYYWKYMCDSKLGKDKNALDAQLRKASKLGSISAKITLARRYIIGYYGFLKMPFGIVLWVQCFFDAIYYSFKKTIDDYA